MSRKSVEALYMIQYARRATGIVVLLLFSFYCAAQIELSAAIGLGYPQVFTSNNTIITSGQMSSGALVGIAYKPAEMQFFPCLYLSYGNIRLPLQESGKNVAALNFNYSHVMVNEKYVVSLSHGQVCLYGGLGFSYLRGNSIGPSGGQTIVAVIDSTRNISRFFSCDEYGA